MSLNGFEFSEFTGLIEQLEQLGADMDQVAERVLDAGSEPARLAFQKNVPRSKKNKEHAQDNVMVSKTRESKYGNKYRVIGAAGKKVDMKRTRVTSKGKVQHYTEKYADQFSYLYFVEHGTTRAPARPFLEKAYRDAQAAANEPMKNALVQEIENHLR